MVKKTSFALCLLFCSFVFQRRVQAQTSQPSLIITPESIEVQVTERFETNIELNTAGQQAGGVGAKLSFDPKLLKVVKITTEPIFPDYPSKTFDNQSGSIVISGVVQSLDQLYMGKAVFAKIEWEAVSTGNAQVSFIYEPNSTRDSNIAVMTGSGDALGYVNTLQVKVVGNTNSGINSQNPPTTQIEPVSTQSSQYETVTQAIDTQPPENTTLVIQNAKRQSFTLPNTGLILFLFALSLATNVYFLFKTRELRKKLIRKQYRESEHNYAA